MIESRKFITYNQLCQPNLAAVLTTLCSISFLVITHPDQPNMGYTRTELLSVNSSINGLPNLSSEVINVIKQYNLNCDSHPSVNSSLPSSAHTRRGVRAGRRKQRPISVRITQRPSVDHKLPCVYTRCLTPIQKIPSTNNQIPHSGRKFKFCLFNAQSVCNKALSVRDYISEKVCDLRDMAKRR